MVAPPASSQPGTFGRIAGASSWPKGLLGRGPLYIARFNVTVKADGSQAGAEHPRTGSGGRMSSLRPCQRKARDTVAGGLGVAPFQTLAADYITNLYFGE